MEGLLKDKLVETTYSLGSRETLKDKSSFSSLRCNTNANAKAQLYFYKGINWCVVLRRWGVETNVWFINRVDN